MQQSVYIQLLENILNHREKSRAQLYQDIFALHFNGYQKNLFFVEFGATNGIDFSNTFILEKDFNWRGILAEPLPYWHEALKSNRTCAIDTRCVFNETGKFLNFANTLHCPDLSGLVDSLPNDFNYNNRIDRDTIKVETVSLNDLLVQHHAPHKIDYLSIDTEGSELEILSAFDFHRYQVGVITVEHNFITVTRDAICKLLESNGFIRICTSISRWDDWYVHRSNRLLELFLAQQK